MKETPVPAGALSIPRSVSAPEAVASKRALIRGSETELVLNFEIYSPGEDPVTRRKNAEKNPED